MCNKRFVLWLLLVSSMIGGCFGKAQRKSVNYYVRNATTIGQLRSVYDSLYQVNPFSIGYTDKSFKYYFVEFTTDSIRWVYNNLYSPDSLTTTIKRMGYSPQQFNRLILLMKDARSLWLDKVKRYTDGKPMHFTYISFRSVVLDKPFMENKYYVLVFPADSLAKDALHRSAKKGVIVSINDTVFFTISNRFR